MISPHLLHKCPFSEFTPLLICRERIGDIVMKKVSALCFLICNTISLSYSHWSHFGHLSPLCTCVSPESERQSSKSCECELLGADLAATAPQLACPTAPPPPVWSTNTGGSFPASSTSSDELGEQEGRLPSLPPRRVAS